MILTTYKRNKKREILDYIEAICDKEYINIRDNKLLKTTYYESLLKALKFIDKNDGNIIKKINKIIKSLLCNIFIYISFYYLNKFFIK